MSGGEWWVGVVSVVRARYSCRGIVGGGSFAWVLGLGFGRGGLGVLSLFSRSSQDP